MGGILPEPLPCTVKVIQRSLFSGFLPIKASSNDFSFTASDFLQGFRRIGFIFPKLIS